MLVIQSEHVRLISVSSGARVERLSERNRFVRVNIGIPQPNTVVFRKLLLPVRRNVSRAVVERAVRGKDVVVKNAGELKLRKLGIVIGSQSRIQGSDEIAERIVFSVRD